MWCPTVGVKVLLEYLTGWPHNPGTLEWVSAIKAAVTASASLSTVAACIRESVTILLPLCIRAFLQTVSILNISFRPWGSEPITSLVLYKLSLSCNYTCHSFDHAWSMPHLYGIQTVKIFIELYYIKLVLHVHIRSFSQIPSSKL